MYYSAIKNEQTIVIDDNNTLYKVLVLDILFAETPQTCREFKQKNKTYTGNDHYESILGGVRGLVSFNENNTPNFIPLSEIEGEYMKECDENDMHVFCFWTQNKWIDFEVSDNCKIYTLIKID